MRRGVLWIVLVLSMLIVAACGGSEDESPAATAGLPQGELVKTGTGAYFNVDVNQVKPLLDADSVLTVNVHVPYAGDIPGTDASIPFNEVAQQVDALPADKDAPVVVYCRSGSMSAQASETLAGLGYTQVYNLDGGMIAWQRAGNQLVQPDQSSDPQGPRLVFAQTMADYGEVPIDQAVTHQFAFTNQGDAPLIVDGNLMVKTLAGC